MNRTNREQTLEDDVLDFDQVYDSTSALEIYVALRDSLEEDRCPQVTYQGHSGNPERVLKGGMNYDFGFKPGVLPAGIKNISFNDEGYYPTRDYEISFEGTIDQEAFKVDWEGLGFKTRKVKKSLVIVDPVDGKTLVKYGIKRAKIPEAKVKRYLTLVKEVDGLYEI